MYTVALLVTYIICLTLLGGFMTAPAVAGNFVTEHVSYTRLSGNYSTGRNPDSNTTLCEANNINLGSLLRCVGILSMKLSLCIDDRLAFILEDTQLAPETLVAVLKGGCALGTSPPSFSLALPLPPVRGPFAGAALSAGAGPPETLYFIFLLKFFSAHLWRSKCTFIPPQLFF
jgi:hypothetical protein